MSVGRRILVGVAIFLGVGWLMGHLQRSSPPPVMVPVLRRIVEIEQPLREACRRSAQIVAHPPESTAARAAARAELEAGRRVAVSAAAAFRRVPIPREVAHIAEVRRGLEAKARMAALSADAIEAAQALVRGDEAAGRRARRLQAEANRAAALAARLLRAAMEKAREPARVPRP